jgi:general secretion pathway protein D
VGGVQGQATNLLPEGVDPPIAYDVDNSLLVRGDPEGLEQLREIIRLLDIPPRQVVIRAEFVDVSIADVDSFGILWDIRPAGNLILNTPTTAAATSLSLVYASGNAVANLRATLTRQTSNVLQAPIISTINNVPASIEVSESIPIFTTNTIFNNNIAQNVTTVNYIQVANGLQVQPRINGDNSITLYIEPQLQNATFVTGPGGQLAPQVSTRALTTYRRVQNGETMVLGGFISKQDTRQLNRVPVLSDLPFIGSLFRSRNRTVTGSEVLIFLTPTIIEDRSTGTLGTGGGAPPPTP